MIQPNHLKPQDRRISSGVDSFWTQALIWRSLSPASQHLEQASKTTHKGCLWRLTSFIGLKSEITDLMMKKPLR